MAEQFGTYPGRIDLGVGRAPGTDIGTAMALRRNLDGLEEYFPNGVMELQNYLGPPKPEAKVRATPGEGLKVPIWLLGLSFAFASHFTPAYFDTAVAAYREGFQPSETLKEPYVLAAAVDTDKEARRLFTSMQLRGLEMIRGNQTPLQPGKQH
jgi:alkanesulfonate monooxygenase SsuD/methylene tetrahydromethanopterin reductase-like flavin-dependent oxidoreductase (luciferase family)